jgi:hypothetical protein
LAVDGSGNIYIGDTDNYVVREFSVGGSINTVAGNGTYCWGSGAACGDGGPAISAELSSVYGIAVDSPGNIFIADYCNYAIREVTKSNGKINSVAGNGSECLFSGAACGVGGPATQAQLGLVYGVAGDSSDDIFIADTNCLVIREVTNWNGTINPVSGTINIVAGNGFAWYSGNGVPATNATLFNPMSAASDGSSPSLEARKPRYLTSFVAQRVYGRGQSVPT